MQSQSRLLSTRTARPIRALSIALTIVLFGVAGSLHWAQLLTGHGTLELTMQLSSPRSFRADLLAPGALLRVDFELRNHGNQPFHNLIVVLPYRRGQLAYLEGGGKVSSNVLLFIIANLASGESWHGYALFRLDQHLAAGTLVTLQAAAVQAGHTATSSAPAIIVIEAVDPPPDVIHTPSLIIFGHSSSSY